jgi:hypothetical protein
VEELKDLVDSVEDKDAPKDNTVDMSNTMHAEIGTSDRFLCPEGHEMQEIDGTIAQLPSNQCSGYCGAENE